MALEIDQLLPQMLAAASAVVDKKWPVVKAYAESEFKKIGQELLFIEQQVISGKMTREQAELHLELQTQASRNVMLALEGMSILTAEAAINAALGAVKQAVNAAIGIALLP